MVLKFHKDISNTIDHMDLWVQFKHDFADFWSISSKLFEISLWHFKAMLEHKITENSRIFRKISKKLLFLLKKMKFHIQIGPIKKVEQLEFSQYFLPLGNALLFKKYKQIFRWNKIVPVRSTCVRALLWTRQFHGLYKKYHSDNIFVNYHFWGMLSSLK